MSATDANKIQTPPLRLHESYTLNGQPLDLEYWAALTSKFQRDLLWAIHGPSMLDTAWTLNVSNSLPQLSINALLTQRVNDPYRSPRIGLCFEQLWQHALRTGAIDFAANVQIIDNGTTLGELDLLLLELPNPGQSLHLELALKFYLGTPTGWIGPNRRDRFVDKLAHTQNHQMPIATSIRGQEVIAGAGYPQVSASKAIFRGCLFHPMSASDAATELPEIPRSDDFSQTEFSQAGFAKHWQGRWCRIGELPRYLSEGAWFVLSKDEWISPLVSHFVVDQETLLAHLDAHFRYLSSALCIARMQSSSSVESTWVECERWMIVANDWQY